MHFNIATILAVLALCVMSVKSEEEKKICPFLAACLKETDGKVKIEDMKALMDARLEDVDDIPENVLCVSKCAMEKRKVLVDGKIDTDKLSNEKMLMKNIENKADYIECVKKIEEIKECGDVKELVKCNLKFSKE